MPGDRIADGRDGRPRVHVRAMPDGGYTWRVGVNGPEHFQVQPGKAFEEALIACSFKPFVLIYEGGSSR